MNNIDTLATLWLFYGQRVLLLQLLWSRCTQCSGRELHDCAGRLHTNTQAKTDYYQHMLTVPLKTKHPRCHSSSYTAREDEAENQDGFDLMLRGAGSLSVTKPLVCFFMLKYGSALCFLSSCFFTLFVLKATMFKK